MIILHVEKKEVVVLSPGDLGDPSSLEELVKVEGNAAKMRGVRAIFMVALNTV